MNSRNLKWLLILSLVGAAIYLQTAKMRGPVPPRPDDLSAMDPDVAKLIDKFFAHVQRKPSDIKRWLELGKVYEANAFHALAGESYQHVLDRDPNQGKAWFRRAICAERVGNLDDAITFMDRAIDLEPNFAPARWRQSMWLVDTGNLELAAKRADEAIALDKQSKSAWFAKARVLLANRENDEAIRVIENQRLRNDSNGNYASYLLGTAYRQKGELEKAAPFLSVSKNFRPNWKDAWSGELSKYHTGLSKLRAVASNYVRRGRYQEALPLLKKAVAADPKDDRALNMLGASYMHLRQFPQCLDAFKAAVVANPNSYSSNLNFATANLVSLPSGIGDAEKGLEHANRAASIRPDAAGAALAQGKLLIVLRRPTEAVQAFQRGYELDARTPGPAIEAANAEWLAGQQQESIERLEQAVNAHPRFANARLALAHKKIQLGDTDAARELLKAAMSAEVCSNAERQMAQTLLKNTEQSAAGAK